MTAIATTRNKDDRLKNYQLIKVIGKGCMGKVMLSRDLRSGQLVAIKSISKAWVAQQGGQEIEHTRTEQRILARLSHLNHPFLIKLHSSFQTENNLVLVLDYVDGGDLATQLAKYRRFCVNRSRFYCAEIAEGLRELHRWGIIYRDCKPENVLLHSSGHIKLTDFGLSKWGDDTIHYRYANGNSDGNCSSNMSNSSSRRSSSNQQQYQSQSTPITRAQTFCGTAEYLAPEILLEQTYSFAVDWWSLGTFLYEMLTGITPFWAEDQLTMYRRVLEDPLEFPPDIPIGQDAKDLISQLLDRRPDYRLSFGDQMRQHAFFRSIDWNELLALQIRSPYLPHVRGDTDVSHFDEEFTRMTPRFSPAIHSLNGRVGDFNHIMTDLCGDDGRCGCALQPSSQPSLNNIGGGDGCGEEDAFAGYSYLSSSAEAMMSANCGGASGGDIPAISEEPADFIKRWAMKRRRGSIEFSPAAAAATTLNHPSTTTASSPTIRSINANGLTAKISRISPAVTGINPGTTINYGYYGVNGSRGWNRGSTAAPTAITEEEEEFISDIDEYDEKKLVAAEDDELGFSMDL